MNNKNVEGRKFFLETYGCQMNVSDSEIVSTLLVRVGFVPVDRIEDADIIIFNTCSVRQHAEDRVLGRIANEKFRKQEYPGLQIGVIGCMAQRLGDNLIAMEPGIDFVVGVDRYHELEDVIGKTVKQRSSTEFDPKQVYPGVAPTRNDHYCAFVTIMRGCDNYCSYCIVPYVRGRERSRALRDVISEVKEAVDSGHKDVTLLGQNVNSYRYDAVDFPALLSELEKVPGLRRLRFITSHPKDLSDRLIEVMAQSTVLCNHIHLPMQSGDTAILGSMNRGYSIEDYLRKVGKLRNAIPDIAITTDLIAGFPSETEEQFENTLAVMREIRFDYAFCFKYSNRSGTMASGFSHQVPEEERLHRLQKMIDLQREITFQVFRSQIGKEVEIYVEGFSRKSEQRVSGKTRDYKIAVVDGNESSLGSFVKATVKDATSGTLIC
jgi:tRNA-2-methylthio-N6-dimethylallyladenosine synthase